MKTKLLLLFMFVMIAITAFASPVKSKWVRQIFIGAKDKVFYTLRIERNHPGNYYAWSQSEFLTSNTLTSSGRVITHSKPVRYSRFSKDVKDDTLPVRRSDLATTDTLNLQRFLQENQIDYVFPQYGQFIVTDEGLFMVNGDQRELLLPIENVKMNLEPPTFQWVGDEKFTVSGQVFIHGNFALLAVQYGTPDSEIDLVETIVAVPIERYEKAKGKLGIK